MWFYTYDIFGYTSVVFSYTLMKNYIRLLGLAALLLTTGAAAQTANFERIWEEHNVTENGSKGIRIHTEFTVDGVKGVPCTVIAYFYSPKDTKLKDLNGSYRTKGGQVCV